MYELKQRGLYTGFPFLRKNNGGFEHMTKTKWNLCRQIVVKHEERHETHGGFCRSIAVTTILQLHFILGQRQF